MTGISFGVSFSLFLTALVSIVLFVYTWMKSHGVSHITRVHVDGTAGDEGED